MAELYAPVVEYEAEEHPNADRLELAVVDGWRAACPVGKFQPGQKVAYIPEGALLPWDLVEELGLADPPRLAGPKRNRVKPIRLRGELSQGLIYGGDRIAGLQVGDNAVESLGLVKWVPPVPVHMGGKLIPGPQLGFDIDNLKRWPDRLVDGEPVVITEKLHGTFCCFGLIRKGARIEPVVSSKGVLGKGLRFDLGEPDNARNLYVRAWQEHAHQVHELFDLVAPDSSMFLFGEIIGPKVQDLTYGQQSPGFRLFDMLIDRTYADWETVVDHAGRVGIPTVPVLFTGPWSSDLVAEYTDGSSTLAAHHREGVVIKTVRTRYDTGTDHPSGKGPGRVILKSVSAAHLLRKGGTEYQ